MAPAPHHQLVRCLTVAQAALRLGRTPDAIRSALRRARRARRAGETGEHLFPEPDLPLTARVPAWSPQALDAWRPLGRGARTDRYHPDISTSHKET